MNDYNFNIPNKLQEETKLDLGFLNFLTLYGKDLAFVFVWVIGFVLMRNLVATTLQIPFILFGIGTAIYLVAQAGTKSPVSRNWEAIILKVFRNRETYMSLKSNLYERESISRDK